jgi:hypothetical protein
MGSTFSSTARPVQSESDTPVRWRNWPLIDHARWSWLVVGGIAAVAGIVAQMGGSWLVAGLMAAGLAVTLWQFFLPVYYEISQLGLQQRALGRARLVPWHAIHAYRVRPTGVVLYQRHDPATIDLLRSMFVPYPPNRAESLNALRHHLSHAIELPE